MKLAIAGSFGHVGNILTAAAAQPEVELVAAVRAQPGDDLGPVLRHAKCPAGLAVYDDLDEMIERCRPDVVGVCMPLWLNAATSMRALQAGCHVITEKPLATEMDDLDRLAEAASSARREVLGLFTMRGKPAFLAARQMISDGVIGRCVLSFAQKSYPFATRPELYKQRKTYGGSIAWQAIHAIDFTRFVTGQRFTRVSAMQSNAAHPDYPGMEDNGGILLQTQAGHAIISFDFLRPWPGEKGRSWGDDRLRVAGTQGILEVVGEGSELMLMTPADRRQVPLGHGQDVVGSQLEFLLGRGQPLATTADSFYATRVALGAREAADTGSVVELGPE